jgi:2-(1,2-epoxy-1,2-dihydrophenyl)acetyl-CoA isomerase
MNDYETVKYRLDRTVAVITLNRPDSMNAFNHEMRRDLTAALVRAASNASVRAVVLTGEGRSFCAGADLKDSASKDQSIQQTLQTEYRTAFDCIASMGKPVIAAVGGSAAGIGVSYALCCDLMIMADNAFLLAPFSTISLVPDGGLNWLLVQQLGYRRAFQLCVEAERIPAARCVELGLANRAVPADSLLDEALEWAHSLTERAPLSIAATKKAMRHAASGSWASTFDVEANLQDKLKESQDCAEGIAAFFEKRKANFSGR